MRGLAVLLLATTLLSPLAASDPGVRLPCHPAPSLGPLDTTCVPPIHPGARSSACTLNWIVTDGVDLYAGAARHCTGSLGQALFVEGVTESVGVLAWQGDGDAAFYRIDPEDRPLVSGALEGWGGPHAGPTGVAVRQPYPGEVVLIYGHGYWTDDQPVLRGRPAVTLYAYGDSRTVILAGSASGGDSGAPYMLASGEAAGFISAGVFVNNLIPTCPPPARCDLPSQGVFASPLHLMMRDLGRALGRPVTLVEGEARVTI